MKKAYSLNKLKQKKTKAILFIVSLAICSLIFNNTGIYSYFKMKAEMKTLKETRSELTAIETKLTEQIESLKTDSIYIENLIRKKLKRVSPGEKTFLIQNK